jgi:hypothetical protein
MTATLERFGHPKIIPEDRLDQMLAEAKAQHGYPPRHSDELSLGGIPAPLAYATQNLPYSRFSRPKSTNIG